MGLLHLSLRQIILKATQDTIKIHNLYNMQYPTYSSQCYSAYLANVRPHIHAYAHILVYIAVLSHGLLLTNFISINHFH